MDNSVLVVVSRLSSYSSSILSSTSETKDQSNNSRELGPLLDPVTTRRDKHACGKPMLTDHDKQAPRNREPARGMRRWRGRGGEEGERGGRGTGGRGEKGRKGGGRGVKGRGGGRGVKGGGGRGREGTGEGEGKGKGRGEEGEGEEGRGRGCERREGREEGKCGGGRRKGREEKGGGRKEGGEGGRQGERRGTGTTVLTYPCPSQPCFGGSKRCARVTGKAGENGRRAHPGHDRRLPSVVTHSRL